MIEQTPPAPPAWRAFVRPLILLLVVVLVIAVLRRIPRTIELFVVSTLIAYGINPVIHALEKRMPRLVVIIVVYSVFLLLLVVGTIIVVPAAIDQMQTLISNSDDYLSAAQTFISKEEQWVNQRLGGHMLPAQLQNLQNTAISRITDMLQVAFSSLGTIVVSLVNAIIIGVTAIILSYYFLVHAKEIKATYLSLFPDRTREKAEYFARQVGNAFGGFVGGQIILSTFCTVFTFLGLELIQSQYALLLGILTGVLYAIPYLGVFAVVLVGFLLGLLQSWKIAFLTVVIMLVVTKIADTLLVPKVMSESVGVSPMAIIFAVFAGGELFGVWGLLLAIPASALFKCLWIVWIYPWLTGKPVATDTTTATAASVPAEASVASAKR